MGYSGGRAREKCPVAETTGRGTSNARCRTSLPRRVIRRRPDFCQVRRRSTTIPDSSEAGRLVSWMPHSHFGTTGQRPQSGSSNTLRPRGAAGAVRHAAHKIYCALPDFAKRQPHLDFGPPSRTGAPRARVRDEVSEAVLARTIKDRVKAACLRTDLRSTCETKRHSYLAAIPDI